jgi:non-ribosomal peptide synthase protein (TIGR01720 family)
MVPSAFVVLERLPLTGSGKVDRRALPAPDVRVEQKSFVAPSTPAEAELASIWAGVLGVDRVGTDDNFFELGGDSILSIQVVSRARQAGLALTSKDIFLHQTIGELAAAGVLDHAGPGTGARDGVEEEAAAGPAPLGPIQRWFTQTATGDLSHFTMSVLAELDAGVKADALARAVDAVVAHHDALRMRFSAEAGQWAQDVAPAEIAAVFDRRDLSGVDADAQLAAMEKAAVAAQTSLDITAGPLVKAVLFTRGAGQRPALFIAVHHLVVDGVSWRILLGDLETAYRQIRAGQSADLGPRTTSYRQWARTLAGQVRAGAFDGDLAYWASQPATVSAVLPAGQPDGDNTAGQVATVTVRLGQRETGALLHQVPGVYRTQVNDVLLAALGRVVAEWTGQADVLIAMEGHGREDIADGVDLSRTVGWFTTEFPVALHLPASPDWGPTLKSVKEQLRAVPRRGLSYGALRYLSGTGSPAAALAGGPAPMISFNYHGQWDAAAAPGDLFRSWHGPIGQDIDPAAIRACMLEITGTVTGGQLELGWTYPAGIYDQATITRLAERMIQALGEITAHCAQPGTGGRTPSDFPLARLDQPTVDRLAGDGRHIDDIWPLTPLQAGLLFHTLIEPGMYIDQASITLDGVSGPAALGQAWQLVVDRTPVLRASVAWEHVEEPAQVIHRQAVPARARPRRAPTPGAGRGPGRRDGPHPASAAAPGHRPAAR